MGEQKDEALSITLADDVDLDLVGPALGRDVGNAVRSALAAGAVFPKGTDPLSVFRATLSESIRDIEHHPMGELFREFLSKGPYVDSGPIPLPLRRKHLSDDDVGRVTSFIHSFMVNSFKGAVAELLAAGAATRLTERLKRAGLLPPYAKLFVGDAVLAHCLKDSGWRKGADLHVLSEEADHGDPGIRVAGIAEVKSYFQSERRLREQIDRHIRRARRGLRVGGAKWPGNKVRLGYGPAGRIIRITVEPSDWPLPRSFRFRMHGEGRRLHVTPTTPPLARDEVAQTGQDDWRITLRWSKEALAEAAYETTFWYMGKVGEALYSGPKAMPKEWAGMTPSEAGRNAAKMMLYYAILRARNLKEDQRAIALYNAYGFGYSVGMGFRNPAGRREMLWPRDLDEIARDGMNRDGCRIAESKGRAHDSASPIVARKVR